MTNESSEVLTIGRGRMTTQDRLDNDLLCLMRTLIDKAKHHPDGASGSIAVEEGIMKISVSCPRVWQMAGEEAREMTDDA